MKFLMGGTQLLPRVADRGHSEWDSIRRLAEIPNISYNEAMHKHLRRLDRIWVDAPIYFITMCTKDRRAVLAQAEVAEILIEEWGVAQRRHGWGRRPIRDHA
jgi:hypothetical protein